MQVIIKCSFKIIQNQFVHFTFVFILVPIFLRKREKKLETLKLSVMIEKKKLLWK